MKKDLPSIKTQRQITMTKTIKKYGNSLIIVFNAEDIQILDVKLGDNIEFQIQSVHHNKEKEVNNGIQRK